MLDTKQSELMRYASATLGSSNLREAVKLPHGEDPNEWIAVNSTLLYLPISCMFFHRPVCVVDVGALRTSFDISITVTALSRQRNLSGSESF